MRIYLQNVKPYAILRLAVLANVVFFIIGVLRAGVLQLSSSSISVKSSSSAHPVSTSQRRPSTRAIFAELEAENNISVPVAESSVELVPNIVHYIWYNTAPRPLQFHHMLSVLSAHKILRPDVIYFHTNVPPTGPYWQRIIKLPNFKVNRREPPMTLFGEKIKEPVYYTSHSNVDRVLVLMEYGGIYLDFDVLVIRPFGELRRYPCTIGREQETKACGSVIVCAPTSPFLLLWINSYIDDYRDTEWAYNTGQVPFNLARRFPHLVHLDENRINRPNFLELDRIWGRKWFDWQQNYAVHLWYRLWKDQSPYFVGIEPNEENIKTWNSTFGEMARTIMYGVRGKMSSDAISI